MDINDPQPLTLKNFNTFRRLQKVYYNCEQCSKYVIRNFQSVDASYKKFKKFLCTDCALKERTKNTDYNILQENLRKSNLKKYGVEYTSSLSEVKAKISNSCKESTKNSDFTERNKKSKETLTKRYGSVENAVQHIINKSRKTVKKRYGVDHVFQSKEIKEKIKQTNLKKYGVTNPGGTKEVQKKIKSTLIKKYGVENAFQSEEIKGKIKQTNLKKYGVESYAQTKEYHQKCHKKYLYNNEKFDSSWELAFYIYHIDNGIPIKRNPRRLAYIFNNKKHYYFPDFEVNGNLIEIKGGQFFTKNIYDGGCFKKEIDNAKIACIKNNNVIIISNKEIKPYLNYITNIYGKNYLSQFKIKN